ncbi:MAG TPA: PP2C family protein-serine/threonine phosphatase [Thermoleophilaceae bacterium]
MAFAIAPSPAGVQAQPGWKFGGQVNGNGPLPSDGHRPWAKPGDPGIGRGQQPPAAQQPPQIGQPPSQVGQPPVQQPPQVAQPPVQKPPVEKPQVVTPAPAGPGRDNNGSGNGNRIGNGSGSETGNGNGIGNGNRVTDGTGTDRKPENQIGSGNSGAGGQPSLDISGPRQRPPGETPSTPADSAEQPASQPTAPTTPAPQATPPTANVTPSAKLGREQRGNGLLAGGGATGRSPLTSLPAAPATLPSIIRPGVQVPSTAAAPATPAAAKRPAAAKKDPTPRKRHGASVVERTVHDIVKVVPEPMKYLIATLAGLLVMAAFGWAFVTLRARSLRRQRAELLGEVGLLQAALLPEVPERLGALSMSVAYRPADGPGAGGDFYDAFQMEKGRVGIVIGDVAGHGRDALARTALLRYTLRAYLETGLEPRKALQIAGRTLEEDMDAGFATAAVAVYDPAAGTLTYSCAGHPPPILLGEGAHDPITVSSSPPLGAGEATGLRQTTAPLVPGATACFFTDGLAEARVDGDMLGRERLAETIASLGERPDATALLAELRSTGHVPDDMAACIISPLAARSTDRKPTERTEEIEVPHYGGRALFRFLMACGLDEQEAGEQTRLALAEGETNGGAIVRVLVGDGEPRVTISPPVIELIEAYSRRRLAS